MGERGDKVPERGEEAVSMYKGPVARDSVVIHKLLCYSWSVDGVCVGTLWSKEKGAKSRATEVGKAQILGGME